LKVRKGDFVFASRHISQPHVFHTYADAIASPPDAQAAAVLGPVNTCFAPTTMTDFSRNKARAAQQSKLCKR
jgi:hypothetical protein